jgi:hypothetical protein
MTRRAARPTGCWRIAAQSAHGVYFCLLRAMEGTMDIPALPYIDDDLIDELWMGLKQDGIPIERIDTAKAHLSAKAKFGLGKVLEWLVTDLKTELDAGVAGERATKIAYAATARLPLLVELLPSVRHIALEQHDLIAALKPHDFIDINCPALSFALLPRFGDYLHVQAMNALGQADTSELAEKPSLTDIGTFAQKFSTLNAAYSFHARLSVEDRTDALFRLNDQFPLFLINMMCLCEDNMVLAAALADRDLSRSNPNDSVVSLIVACFKKAKLKINALSFIGRLRLFGRVLCNDIEDDAGLMTRMVAIEPITLSVG